jgi:hypothetical protein
MIRIAASHYEKMEVSDIELKREGPSYSYITVQQIHELYPDAKLYLLMGTDMFTSFLTWRNPEEIVWGYAISHQLGYEETRGLLNTAALLFSSGSGDHGPDVFTHMVRAEVLEHLAGTPDDLLAYIAGNMEKWSAYHNSAYDLFMCYMQLLQTATPDQEEFEARKADFEKEKKAGRTEAEMDDAMTVDTILDTYFFRRIIGMDGEMDSLQRSIRMYWPDESTLSKMKRRSADVSRKTLILLFLATNGSATEYQTDEDEELDERQSRDKVFRSIYIRLNRMRSRCGFQPLDPRSPFDWMVIFCICVEDIWDTDRRLTTVLAGLFPGSEEHTGNR